MEIVNTNIILQGDALQELKKIPTETINCCMTSPPYWALRDYGIEGQLGLEKTFEEYITKLCDIFDEVKRVLRKDGTCWVNLGDTYYSVSGGKFENDRIGSHDRNELKGLRTGNKLKSGKELIQKNLCNIPARFSIEMQNRGWILRNVIIWHKPNCMPSSVKDRFTVDFEYLFFFVKNKKYWFETIYEPIKTETIKRNKYGEKGRGDGIYAVGGTRKPGSFMSKVPYAVQPRDKEVVEYRDLPDIKQFAEYINHERKRAGMTIEEIESLFGSQAPHHWFNAESFPSVSDFFKLKEILCLDETYEKEMSEVFIKSSEKVNIAEGCRNKRAVWTITTKPFKEAHFATYPEELCETPIKAGCPEFVCNKCGKARYPIYKSQFKQHSVGATSGQYWEVRNFKGSNTVVNSSIQIGLTDCGCNEGFSGGIVLDPFFGAGTTGLVALKQNKQFIGIELNEKYIEIATKRLKPYLEQAKLPSVIQNRENKHEEEAMTGDL